MNEVLSLFGARIRKLRKGKNMTQEDLAEELGLHNSYIGLLERGERIPSLATLDRIAIFFGVKAAELISERPRTVKWTNQQQKLLNIVREGKDKNLDQLYEISNIVKPKKAKK